MFSFNDRLKTMTNERQSWLCVGLDMDPEALGTDSIEALRDHTFKVIDATRDLAVAYKPNFAFFERWGAEGFTWLEETVSYIGDDVKHELSSLKDMYSEGIGICGKKYIG